MENINLKGMTWKHERGLKPLVATSLLFKEKTGIDISWDARSLKDFEEYPLEKLKDKYDLIMIDHPHIGAAHDKKILKELENLLPTSFLAEIKENSVGKSYDSYNWKGHQYAIPIDAAAQVSAYRRDLFKKEETIRPKTWKEVINYANNSIYKIAIPFVPIHAYSSFFTLCSHLSEKPFWSDNNDLSIKSGVEALNILSEVINLAYEKSCDMNPIDVLETMSNSNEISYSPLIYGYSNYSRDNYSKYIIKFRNIPVYQPSDNNIIKNNLPKGSMLGGVGLAISANCKFPNEAIEFIKLISNSNIQSTLFFDNGGQPGNIIAWKDKHVNFTSKDFFIKTLDTLSLGSLRPRFNGYVDFQLEAGNRIRDFIIQKKKNKENFITDLNKLLKEYNNK